jgi:hypothetical protein
MMTGDSCLCKNFCILFVVIILPCFLLLCVNKQKKQLRGKGIYMAETVREGR